LQNPSYIDLEGVGIGGAGEDVKAMCGEEGGSDCPIISINLKRNGIGDEGASPSSWGTPSSSISHNEGSDLLFGAILERQRLGLSHADFYCGFNPGIKYGTWWETLFGGSVKQKSG
jgi:hypothetical protein